MAEREHRGYKLAAMRPAGRALAIVALPAALVAIACTSPGLAIRIASGATSQTVCSKTFVAGLPPEQVYAEDIRPEPGMGLIDWALRMDVDRARREVRTTVGGLFETRAVYREGYGCVLVHGADPAPLHPPAPDETPSLLPEIAGPDVVTTNDRALAAVLDRAFAEPATGPHRWTQAVLVVHEGHLIAERYAPGFGVETPLLSHSVAKSVLDALIGILVRRGALALDEPAPVAAWHAGDPRAAITIDELLRMSSGLPVDEGMGPGLAQRMWFVESDTAAFAARSPLAHAPGTSWAYSNQGYALLSRIAANAIGGGPEGFVAFARRELFAPLGMRHAVVEFDAAGTPMGSNAMFATAREWARFGLLFLDEGVVGGTRILPEGWVANATRPTLDTGYGAGFWLNNTSTPIPVWGLPWGLPSAPCDAFMARGYLGQYVVVVPPERLVVVRFGATHMRGGDVDGVGALVRDVVEALHPVIAP